VVEITAYDWKVLKVQLRSQVMQHSNPVTFVFSESCVGNRYAFKYERPRPRSGHFIDTANINF